MAKLAEKQGSSKPTGTSIAAQLASEVKVSEHMGGGYREPKNGLDSDDDNDDEEEEGSGPESDLEAE